MDPTLLAAIIAASAANRNETSPHGYCFRNSNEAAALQALAGGGMLEVGAPGPNGVPVRPTDAAMKWHAEAQAQAHHTPQPGQTQQRAQHPVSVTLEDNVPMPEAKRAGFNTREGGSLVDQYGFANMTLGQSFFVPQSASTDPKKAVHRTFSSVVSQANKKLHPMAFAIREVDETAHGRGKGARVWRVADMQGERPTRSRRKAGQSQGQGQPQAPHMPPASQFDPSQQHAPFAGPGFTNHGGAAAQQPGFSAAQSFGGDWPAPPAGSPEAGFGQAPVGGASPFGQAPGFGGHGNGPSFG